jgi:hypothetical protein
MTAPIHATQAELDLLDALTENLDETSLESCATLRDLAHYTSCRLAGVPDMGPTTERLSRAIDTLLAVAKSQPIGGRALKYVVLLRDFGRSKERAIRFRLRGNGITAVRLEDECERLYNQLPLAARW